MPSNKDNTFLSLGLDEAVCKRLEQLGFNTPTPCQKQYIPSFFQEKRTFIQAATGQGKTLAFLSYAFDLLTRIDQRNINLGAQILILAPTRNLASQTYDVALKINKTFGFKISGLWGAHNDLDPDSNIIISTTGSLLSCTPDLHPVLENIKLIILDEADRLFDTDFFQQTDAIQMCIPKKANLILCSATLSMNLKKYFHIKDDADEDIQKAPIRQRAVFLKESQKPEYLLNFLQNNVPEKVSKIIVFVASRKNVEEITKLLKPSFGKRVYALHGGLTDAGRSKQIRNFEREGKQILVTTDLTGRGMDFKCPIDLVINYDAPNSAETYLHRIGRSGRGNKRGDSLTLLTVSQRETLVMIEKELKQKIPVIPT